ncbi:carbonic anhydrase-related protein 10-like [Tropilaelaps mercedesae]|uniref:Carbonic anhydrase-related protein 10-like n=1 Tax=Tropilaelaps mercedesae TaxID=418985 RepID=A0A1V9XS52_9ACAR|nr:carbonic anhydrase-related protein 10-like [Tropilaelaps mercedesae]
MASRMDRVQWKATDQQNSSFANDAGLLVNDRVLHQRSSYPAIRVTMDGISVDRALPVRNVSGSLVNTGHGIVFRVPDSDSEPAVFIRGGPLSYGYRFYELHLHYGKSDEQGSEHTIATKQFPAEVSYIG